MNCNEASVLLHALIDDELDAGHAREIETHIASCRKCTAELREYRNMHDALSAAALRYAAPYSLQAGLDRILPAKSRANRRELLKGFAIGTTATAIAASGLFVMVMRKDDQQHILNETISAHLRSLQADHLTDVQSNDQHTIKPWFNGRLDIAPPVVELSAQGFTLLGGRLDYIDGKPVAVIVYRRRIHVINLFVLPESGTADRNLTTASLHGFNVRRWSENGFSLLAVSDINPDELGEFGERIEKTLRK